MLLRCQKKLASPTNSVNSLTVPYRARYPNKLADFKTCVHADRSRLPCEHWLIGMRRNLLAVKNPRAPQKQFVNQCSQYSSWRWQPTSSVQRGTAPCHSSCGHKLRPLVPADRFRSSAERHSAQRSGACPRSRLPFLPPNPECSYFR